MTTLDERIAAGRKALEHTFEGAPPDVSLLMRRAARRRQRVAALAAVVAVGTVAAGVLAVRDDGAPAHIVAGPDVGGSPQRNAGLLAPGQVRALPPAPIAGRSSPAAVWTGAEFVVWGGGGASGRLGDGAAYDPRADTWRVLAAGPLAARENPAAVWTGTEVVIWGGGAGGPAFADGAAYDPRADTWRTMATAPVPGWIRPSTVWTGAEMIVLADANGSPAAAAYDPTADRWRRIADPPGRSLPPYPQAVWTGTTAVFAVVAPFASPNDSILTSYDPAADAWTELPSIPIGNPRLAWTDDAGLVVINPTPGGTSARYEPTTGTWTAVAVTSSAGFGSTTPIWTGAVVLGWADTRTVLLNPSSGTWHADPAAGGLSPRESPSTVWADGVMITWGGFASASPQGGRDDGLVYRPPDLAPGPRPSRPPVLPTSTTLAPNLVAVVDGDGVVRGRTDLNGPLARWQGRRLPARPVVDDDGDLVGYFGCRFFERAQVERDGVDLAALCPTVTTRTG